MLGAFWRKVSIKTISAPPRSFKNARVLPEESEKFIKGESRSSQWSEICEMNILLGLPTLLSNEKLQIIRILNQPLKIPKRLLHVTSNLTILQKDFNIGGSDWLLLQRNVDREIIARLERWKSAQSSCEKDGVSENSRGCIEDHRQSAENCAEVTRENVRQQIPAESCRKSCSDLLNHQEYYRSIESNSPICFDKPLPYNDRRACDSMKCDSPKSTVISCEKWTCGKSAMERKVYHKCKPKSCAYPNFAGEAIHFPSDIPRDYDEGKFEEITTDKARRIGTHHSVQQCFESEPLFTEKTCTSSEKISPIKISKPCSASDTNEQLKPDPPPPKSQHWSENPPWYCNQRSKKTVTPIVKPSPMIFVPRKEPWKPWTKGTASSVQDIQEDCGKATSKNECEKTEAKITPSLPKSVPEKCTQRRVISFENKCPASLTFPARGKARTKPRFVQRFPLTRSGRCRVEKPEKVSSTPDVSDCNPSMASFKYQLSKCPSIKEIWSVSVSPESSSDIDVDARAKQEAALSVCEKIKRQEPRAQGIEEGKRKKFKSSGGWTRQRYKTRLKIFQKGNGRLDPCLPRIVELRQPRDGKMQSILSKLFGRAADEGGELSPRLKSPCRPPGDCPSKWPVAENKSYPTKMNESRVVRDKNPCKKDR